jgi:hypothetical protein
MYSSMQFFYMYTHGRIPISRTSTPFAEKVCDEVLNTLAAYGALRVGLCHDGLCTLLAAYLVDTAVKAHVTIMVVAIFGVFQQFLCGQVLVRVFFLGRQ